MKILTAGKVETKVGILLSPEELDSDYLVLTSLHIYKSANAIDYKLCELSRSELNKYYLSLPAPVANTLLQFSWQKIEELQEKIKNESEDANSKISKNVYLQSVMLRQLHQSFESLKPFCNLIKWYHKTTVNSCSRTAPCAFSTLKPQLQFEV
jgi:hypothetical protein